MIRLPGVCRVRRATVINSQIAARTGSIPRIAAMQRDRGGTGGTGALQRLLVVVLILVVVAFVVVRVDVAAAPAPWRVVVVVVIVVARSRTAGTHGCGRSREQCSERNAAIGVDPSGRNGHCRDRWSRGCGDPAGRLRGKRGVQGIGSLRLPARSDRHCASPYGTADRPGHPAGRRPRLTPINGPRGFAVSNRSDRRTTPPRNQGSSMRNDRHPAPIAPGSPALPAPSGALARKFAAIGARTGVPFAVVLADGTIVPQRRGRPGVHDHVPDAGGAASRPAVRLRRPARSRISTAASTSTAISRSPFAPASTAGYDRIRNPLVALRNRWHEWRLLEPIDPAGEGERALPLRARSGVLPAVARHCRR